MKLPVTLRSLAAGQPEVQVDAGTVAECIARLESRFPRLTERLRDEDGELSSSVNLYVNGQDIRHLGGTDTPLTGEDVITIIVAIAGGRS